MSALITKSIRYHTLIQSILMLFSVLGGLLWVSYPAAGADCQAWYTVQPGDTLYKIGLKYNLTWDVIAAVNNITNANKIYSGQVLCIPKSTQPTSVPTTASPTNVQYVKALTDLNMRTGPGIEYAKLVIIKMGQVVKVTGISVNGLWWRVVCPDGSTGSCWISAGSKYTTPTTASGTSPTPVPGSTPAPTPKPVVIPTFSILSVVRDQSVSIQAANFPASMKFQVLMGPYGSAGINGYSVTTFDSGAGGSFKATYTIPAALKGSSRIAIRLVGTEGYFSFNWFWNNTTP